MTGTVNRYEASAVLNEAEKQTNADIKKNSQTEGEKEAQKPDKSSRNNLSCSSMTISCSQKSRSSASPSHTAAATLRWEAPAAALRGKRAANARACVMASVTLSCVSAQRPGL